MLEQMKVSQDKMEVELKILEQGEDIDKFPVGTRFQLDGCSLADCDYYDVYKESETTFLVAILLENSDGTFRNFYTEGEGSVVIRVTLSDEALKYYKEKVDEGVCSLDYGEFEEKRNENTLFIVRTEGYEFEENPYYEVLS